MAVIQRHPSGWDWCHLCGQRSPHSADIWHPTQPNAEHASVEDHRAAYGSDPVRVRYLRVCASCASAIHAAAMGETTAPIVRVPTARRSRAKRVGRRETRA